jgi:hypothetical protein
LAGGTILVDPDLEMAQQLGSVLDLIQDEWLLTAREKIRRIQSRQLRLGWNIERHISGLGKKLPGERSLTHLAGSSQDHDRKLSPGRGEAFIQNPRYHSCNYAFLLHFYKN